jgi:circadian clock protein KaiB
LSRREGTEKQKPTHDARLQLRLYVAGDAPNSVQARANLKIICERYLEPGTVDLEIINVLETPLRALDDGVLVTPTLVAAASPHRSIVGTLEDHEKVKQALGIE